MARITKALERELYFASELMFDTCTPMPDLSSIRSISVKTVLVDMEDQQQKKTRCQYCHGLTFDDFRGNCIACGGER